MREGLQFAETDTAAKTYRTRKNFSDKKISLTKAAKIYLEKLRRDLGDKKMYRILSAQRYSTLIFAIDTTGSMSVPPPKQLQKKLSVQRPNQKLITSCHHSMIQVRFTFLLFLQVRFTI